MISFYEKDIENLERKAKLYEIAEEYDEATRTRRSIESSKQHMGEYKDYVKAMEFYLSHHLQKAI